MDLHYDFSSYLFQSSVRPLFHSCSPPPITVVPSPAESFRKIFAVITNDNFQENKAVESSNWVQMRLTVPAVFLLVLLGSLKEAFGIRFVIDREECFSHKVEYGHTVHFSFVVIKSEGSWHYSEDGVDLVVKGPNGDQVYDVRAKTSDKHDFVAYHQGVYRFCFTNKSPYHETLDFDVHAAHFLYHDEHAKDEHFKPLFEHIGKLEEALYNIQFEQHWLEAQTDRQAIVNEKMSRGAVHKAILESVALVLASGLQVYILRYLFERKLGGGRV